MVDSAELVRRIGQSERRLPKIIASAALGVALGAGVNSLSEVPTPRDSGNNQAIIAPPQNNVADRIDLYYGTVGTAIVAATGAALSRRRED